MKLESPNMMMSRSGTNLHLCLFAFDPPLQERGSLGSVWLVSSCAGVSLCVVVSSVGLSGVVWFPSLFLLSWVVLWGVSLGGVVCLLVGCSLCGLGVFPGFCCGVHGSPGVGRSGNSSCVSSNGPCVVDPGVLLPPVGSTLGPSMPGLPVEEEGGGGEGRDGGGQGTCGVGCVGVCVLLLNNSVTAARAKPSVFSVRRFPRFFLAHLVAMEKALSCSCVKHWDRSFFVFSINVLKCSINISKMV